MADEDGRTGRSAAWGVAAGVFCAGCSIYLSQSGLPVWPTYVLGGLTVVSLYLCFATIWGWRPTSRSIHGTAETSIGPAHASSTEVDNSGAAGRVRLPAPPVGVRLMPELDVVTSRLRLGALNRGGPGRFRAEVVDAHDQDGNWVGPSNWPIPWLDGSVEVQEIPMFGKPLLDFVHFDLAGLKEDLENRSWADGDHWVFSSLPHPVKVGYSAVSEWSELEYQYFVITVRVIRSDPPGHVDTRYKIGIEGTRPYCRESPESPAASAALPTDGRQLRDLATGGRLGERPTVAEPTSAPVTKSTLAITHRWHQTSDGARVPALMRLSQSSVFHPGYGGRQPDETPPSVKVGMLVGCQPIDAAISGTELRAKFLAFLNSPAVSNFVEALTAVDSGMSWKSLAGHGRRTLEAVLTAETNPLDGVPVASALFLPLAAEGSLYGRDEHSATLVLYVEPRTADGQVPSASDLATWSRRFNLALAVPRAFADFLEGDLGAATSNDPPAQLGVWLQSYQPLTVMVDIDGLRMLPGMSQSNRFIGWTFAAPDGKSATGAVRDLMVSLCEDTLHLDGFEQSLIEESL